VQVKRSSRPKHDDNNIVGIQSAIEFFELKFPKHNISNNIYNYDFFEDGKSFNFYKLLFTIFN